MPEVLEAFVVKLLPVVGGEEDAVSDASGSPSGSAAETVNVRRLPSVTDWVAGAITTGARSLLLTVIVVEAVPERAFDTVNVTV